MDLPCGDSMKKLLITCPDNNDRIIEMSDDHFAETLVNTFGTDEEGIKRAMQVRAALESNVSAIIGQTVWSLIE